MSVHVPLTQCAPDALAEEISRLAISKFDLPEDGGRLMALVRAFREKGVDGQRLKSEGAPSVVELLSDVKTLSWETRQVLMPALAFLLDTDSKIEAETGLPPAPSTCDELKAMYSSLPATSANHDPACFITQYLMLGGMQAASDKAHLDEVGVTHILNVADEVECYFLNDFKYLHCQIADGGGDDSIVPAFTTAAHFVKEAIAEDGRVLIHCWAGINRSSTVTMAVLMQLEGWTLAKAYNHTLQQRTIHPFAGNKKKIAQWELETRGQSTQEAWLNPPGYAW